MGKKFMGYDNASELLTAIGTKIKAKYSKPSGGIPKTDLATAVQTSLDQIGDLATLETEDRAALAEVVNTSGKNIFPPSTFQATGSIFAITRYDDGTYLARGGYAYDAYTFVPFTVPNSGTYVLSGCPSGGSTTNGCYLNLRKDDYTVIADSTDIGSGSKPFYIEAGEYKLCINVQNYYFPSSGSIFKPMLCLSSEFNITNDFVKYDMMSRWYYSDLNYTSNAANTMEYCGMNFTVPAGEIYEFYVTDGDGSANPTGIGVCDSSSDYGSNSTIIAENMDSQSTYSSNVRLWTRQVSGITVPYGSNITYYVWVKRSTAAQAKIRLLLKRIK